MATGFNQFISGLAQFSGLMPFGGPLPNAGELPPVGPQAPQPGGGAPQSQMPQPGPQAPPPMGGGALMPQQPMPGGGAMPAPPPQMPGPQMPSFGGPMGGPGPSSNRSPRSSAMDARASDMGAQLGGEHLTGVAKLVYDEGIRAGYTPAQAYGALGSIQQESGFNPNAYNSGEQAFGIAQWRGDRLANLKAYAAERGMDPADPAAQAAFHWYEMGTTEQTAGEHLRTATTPDEAAALHDRYYERSDGKSTATRAANAMMFAGGGDADASYSSSGGPPNDALSSYVPNDGDLDALMPDMSDAEKKRAKKAMIFTALGKGLGQMSSGETVDVTDVINMHVQRQEEAKRRMTELAMERRRRFEIAQQRGWSIEDRQADQQNQRDLIAIQHQNDVASMSAQEALRQQGTAFEYSLSEAAKAAEKAGQTAELEAVKTSLMATMGNVVPQEIYDMLSQLPAAVAVPRMTELLNQGMSAKLSATANAAQTAAEQQANLDAAEAYAASLAGTPDETNPMVMQALSFIQQSGGAYSIEDALKVVGASTPDPAKAPSVEREAFDMWRAENPGASITDYWRAVAQKMPSPVPDQMAVRRGNQWEKQYEVLTTTAEQFRNLEGPLNDAMRAVKNAGTDSGGIEPYLLPVKQMAGQLGLLSDEEMADLSAEEMIAAIGNKMVPLEHATGTGAQSNVEFEALLKSVPSLANTAETNQIMLQGLLNRAETVVAKQEAMYGYNPLTETKSFDQIWREKQEAGEAPSAYYIVKDTNDAQQVLTAYDNGYLEDGDLFVYTDPDGMMQYATVSPDALDVLRNALE